MPAERLKLPEIDLIVESEGDKLIFRNPTVNLGILGTFELGDIPVDLTEADDIVSIKEEIRKAFERIILRFAATVLEERGEETLAEQIWPKVR